MPVPSDYAKNVGARQAWSEYQQHQNDFSWSICLAVGWPGTKPKTLPMQDHQAKRMSRSTTKIVENAGWKWSVATGVTSLPVQD